MAKIKRFHHEGANGYALWWCPACDSPHPCGSWTFDGNEEKPTFHPSFLTTSRTGPVCHCYVEQGNVRYLTDSTHALAGQTVPLPDYPENDNG